ncbi:dynamin family protein [Microbacterium sp.]|uniref:dynamin family protein n=1 Tax=Microbacterium sp. TaxID=51671 RepID=UPI002810A594|nr:dynamin family protein [Microbacterium sp.]
MTVTVTSATEELLRTARSVYADDREAQELIGRLEVRLHEPLRLALAGMVKAGKSTLLNGMLGERLAATDTAECTRVVTWYRYSATPVVTMHLRDGRSERMPIRRTSGLLVFDLGGRTAEEIEWIDVGWPLAALKKQILIDTPGIASLSTDTSARTTRFLTPEQSPSAADAVVYLMRHLHGSDVKFLEAFRDTSAGVAESVCAVAVLSRSDEVGSGRIDSLVSARRVARRYERDGDLASLALEVIPVAGLLAEGARTLRESEYIAFRELAGLERAERERLLISADRFTRESAATGLSVAVREALLSRFGIFGVRLAAALIRGGATNSSELSEAMVQQSGLVELQEFIETHFHPRAATLKARGVVLQLDTLIRQRPRSGIDAIRAGIERFEASAHTLRELSLLARARADGLPLPAEDAAEAQRIVGAHGVTPQRRLGLTDDAEPSQIAERTMEGIDRWRALAESPLLTRDAVAVCAVVVRSLSAVVSEIGAGRDLRPATDVVPAGRPGDGTGQDAAQQGEQHEAGLRGEERLKWRSLLAQRDPLR